MNPNAIIFIIHSDVNININIFSIFSNDVFVMFESPHGYGVNTAKATQLAKIVKRITYSNVLFWDKFTLSTELRKLGF